jgi:hypothetical protein
MRIRSLVAAGPGRGLIPAKANAAAAASRLAAITMAVRNPALNVAGSV